MGTPLYATSSVSMRAGPTPLDLVVTVFLPSFAVAAQAGGHQLDFNFSSAYSTENPLLTVGAIAGGEALRPSTLAQPEVR
jgi:hypothetical protein